ncbi:hypothetical protein C5468_09245 [Photorhabdus luminescens subsp. mexicana]|uniref:Uncharacterized protein n=1 Tax=Photorhabdus luminescens subsp. mexicana TaxID=2100167 RepID=A0A4R4JF23_PHOLU|nr:hypothetical protein C5468_09245 [Photorhabdus luminescens subsp. mexicana]
MDYTEIIISTKSSWLDILYYYVLSVFILFLLFVLKIIIEGKSSNLMIILGVILVLILSSAQLILTGYEYDIPNFINFKIESIKVGGFIFSLLYIILMPRRYSR